MTNEAKETVTWTIDLKKTGNVYKGSATPKADVTIILSDETLTDLASGKVRFRVMFFSNHLLTKLLSSTVKKHS